MVKKSCSPVSPEASARRGATRPRVVPTGSVVSTQTTVPGVRPRPISAITASRMEEAGADDLVESLVQAGLARKRLPGRVDLVHHPRVDVASDHVVAGTGDLGGDRQAGLAPPPADRPPPPATAAASV